MKVAALETWDNVTPIEPGTRLDAEWLARFPLTTKGRHIVDQRGLRFKLAAVNWYGASDVQHVVCGLDMQSLDVICSSIRATGFNAVRLPFSNQMLRAMPALGSVDLELNEWASGLNALEIYDEVIRCLGRHRIAVIINNHTTLGQWSGGIERNGIWFDPTGSTIYTDDQWIEDWAMLARRYARCAHVVGCDLRNELRPSPGTGCCRAPLFPHWGGGGRLDWRAAVERVADRILKEHPVALIVVERIAWPQRGLQFYACNSQPPLSQLTGHLVFAVHHYSWSGPGRFLPGFGVPRTLRCVLRCLCRKRNYGDLNAQELLEQLRREWGFVVEDNICPVWVSEFGVGLGNLQEMKWFEYFVHAMDVLDADWAYWPLFAEGGPKPGGEGLEWYGTLSESWTRKSLPDRRLELLEKVGLTPELLLAKSPDGSESKLQSSECVELVQPISVIPGALDSTQEMLAGQHTPNDL